MSRRSFPAIRRTCAFAVALFLVGCGSDQPGPAASPAASAPETSLSTDVGPGPDPHSYARFDAVRSTHLVLDLDVDFAEKSLAGTVEHVLERIDPDAGQLVLDTRGLTIEAVTDVPSGAALAWELGEARAPLGAPLVIALGEATTSVVVRFRSSPDASGLQWLSPGQTAGGEHPFMFSQAQAIHARSFLPVQDSPGVRTTFEATVRVPAGLRAVMSADNDPDAPAGGPFHFTMPQAIPSYLFAIAVGDLAFKPMGERTGVYAEPSVVEAAAWEFADTEAMMEVSESLFGPYRWGRYDLLILPPSFPFGGMENPRLSFITPTVIAGDRSLVALIAHELAHSWSGNLVTNGIWSDLWLNEGFTVYLEARIMEAVFGADRRAMEDVLGYQSLQEDLVNLPAGDQWLAPDLSERDPEDTFTSIPYEKGRLLIVYLEDRLGREGFDVLLREYFDAHAFQSLTTGRFLDWLEPRVAGAGITRADLLAWIEAPGLPADAVLPESDAFLLVDAALQGWLAGEVEASALSTADWTVHEWLHFVRHLPADAGPERLGELDAVFDLTGSRNAEIAHAWFRQAIRQDYRPAMPQLREYLVRIGRSKLVVPLYRELLQQPGGAALAAEIYAEARPGYHPITASTLDALIP